MYPRPAMKWPMSIHSRITSALVASELALGATAYEDRGWGGRAVKCAVKQAPRGAGVGSADSG